MKKLNFARTLTNFTCAIALVMSPGVTSASAPNISRADRPGDEIILSYDNDLNNQYSTHDLFPGITFPQLKGIVYSTYQTTYLLGTDGSVYYIDGDTGSLRVREGVNNVTAITSTDSDGVGLPLVPSVTFALKSDGTVWSWGVDYNGVMGRETPTNESYQLDDTPSPLTELSNITKVATSIDHGLALRSDGTVWAWGNNTYGEVGTDPSVSSETPGGIIRHPAQVNLPGPAVSIAAGKTHSMALLADGHVYEWGVVEPSGAPQYWRLNPTPAVINGLSNVTAVLADVSTAFVLKSDGTVWGWGKEDQYRPFGGGNNNIYGVWNPVQVPNLPAMQEIQSDNHHAFVGRSVNDGLWIWGNRATSALLIPNSQGAGAYFHAAGQLGFIKPSLIALESISALPDPVTINRGAQQQLNISAHYSNSTTQDVTLQANYVSGNSLVASVNASGNIIGTGVGSTIITVSFNGKEVVVPITVNPVTPQPPTSLSITNGSGAGKLTLSWNAPTDNGGSALTGYQIFRRNGSNPFTQVGTSTTTNFSDSGLITGTLYEYHVKAVNSVGASNPSSTVSRQAPGLLGNPICFLGVCI